VFPAAKKMELTERRENSSTPHPIARLFCNEARRVATNLNRFKESDMNRGLLTAIIVAATLAIAGAAQAAGNAAAGKTKAATCVACHGADGKGVAPNPALAGKPEAQQVQALQDYKSGKRAHPVMKGITASLSDQDMADLSAYYASLK
jgi:cytochrome c553